MANNGSVPSQDAMLAAAMAQMNEAERAELERLLEQEAAGHAPDTAPDGMAPVKRRGRPPKVRSDESAAPLDKLTEDVAGLYFSLAMVVRFFSATDSDILASQAVACASGWVAVANANPAVKRWLKRVVSGNAYTQLATAHLGLAAALLAAHNISILDIRKLFTPSPRVTPATQATYPGAAREPVMSDFPPVAADTSIPNPGVLGVMDERRNG